MRQFYNKDKSQGKYDHCHTQLHWLTEVVTISFLFLSKVCNLKRKKIEIKLKIGIIGIFNKHKILIKILYRKNSNCSAFCGAYHAHAESDANILQTYEIIIYYLYVTYWTDHMHVLT